MLNRNSSDRIAAKKWFKCSLLQRPAIILAILMLAAVFLSSCGYRKNKGVRQNAATGEVQYVIWVYNNMEILASFRILVDSSNCQKIDSLNSAADIFIQKAKAAENCR